MRWRPAQPNGGKVVKSCRATKPTRTAAARPMAAPSVLAGLAQTAIRKSQLGASLLLGLWSCRSFRNPSGEISRTGRPMRKRTIFRNFPLWKAPVLRSRDPQIEFLYYIDAVFRNRTDSAALKASSIARHTHICVLVYVGPQPWLLLDLRDALATSTNKWQKHRTDHLVPPNPQGRPQLGPWPHLLFLRDPHKQ